MKTKNNITQEIKPQLQSFKNLYFNKEVIMNDPEYAEKQNAYFFTFSSYDTEIENQISEFLEEYDVKVDANVFIEGIQKYMAENDLEDTNENIQLYIKKCEIDIIDDVFSILLEKGDVQILEEEGMEHKKYTGALVVSFYRKNDKSAKTLMRKMRKILELDEDNDSRIFSLTENTRENNREIAI